MKKYEKPFIRTILLETLDVLMASDVVNESEENFGDLSSGWLI